ncbi:MAG: hypothetical protein WCT10_00610 [Patescibacteria group bacterium]|jgi:hypothetical protein
MKKRIVLQLTDLALHTRTFRPAKTLEGATKIGPNGEPRGRLYTNGRAAHLEGTFRPGPG